MKEELTYQQKKQLADLYSDLESYGKIFRIASKETWDEDSRKKYEMLAKVCKGMAEVVSLMFNQTKEKE